MHPIAPGKFIAGSLSDLAFVFAEWKVNSAALDSDRE